MPPNLPEEARRAVIRLAARGKSYKENFDEFGMSMATVGRFTKPLGGVIRPELW